MITLIILLILSMTLVSTAGYVVINMMTHTSQMNKSIEEVVVVRQWANLIKQNSKQLGENLTLIPPMGFAEVGSNYLKPPAWIPGKKLNNWELPFIYCPYSLNSDPSGFNNTVKLSSTESYNVETVIDGDGASYVYASEKNPNLSDHNILAMLISPFPSVSFPSCNDVVFDSTTGTYNLSSYNGTVEVITRENSILQRQSQSLTLNPNDVELKINEEVSLWASTSPENYTISVPNNASFYNTDNINFISQTRTLNKQINFIGDNILSSVIDSTSQKTITFKNVVVTLEDVTFGDNIKPIFINSSVYLNNVSLTDAEFIGGKVHASGNIEMKNKAKEIVFKNISADFEDAALSYTSNTGFQGFLIDNSNVIFKTVDVINTYADNISFLIENGSDLTIKERITVGGSGIYSILSLNSNSNLIFDSAILNVNTPTDTAIYSKGHIELNNSIINLNAALSNGIILGSGSSLLLDDSIIGDAVDAPSVAVSDITGAMHVGGASSTIYSLDSCWTGFLFTTADGTISGNSSVPSSDIYKIGNRSQWLCNIN
jgi:hypothetical protein